MRLHRQLIIIIGLFILCFLFQNSITAQKSDSIYSSTLAPFTRLVGGEWHLGDSYSTFEWGVGNQSIISKGYFMNEGSPTLVSEGIWFWHPGEKKIKGFSTAIGMPIAFFDYTTYSNGNILEHRLKCYTAKGEEQNYMETWEFTDANSYVWTLYAIVPEGKTKVMDGTYLRKSDN